MKNPKFLDDGGISAELTVADKRRLTEAANILRQIRRIDESVGDLPDKVLSQAGRTVIIPSTNGSAHERETSATE